MASPQVQEWLNDGSQLRDGLLAQMEELEAQRLELERQLGERRSELSLLARILDRADDEPNGDSNFSPSFDSKAASSGAKSQPKEAWHAGMS